MTAGDRNDLLRAAMTAVRACADKMETQAASLLQALPRMPTHEELRATAIELAVGLKDASGRVTFELALLQTELGEARTDAASALRRLSAMDATMMRALGAMTDIVDRLESAAEADEQIEQAYVRVIEAVAVMLRGFENAKAATEALRAGMPSG